MKYDKDPFADDVQSRFLAYECGWTEFAPVDETEKAPKECMCGAELKSEV